MSETFFPEIAHMPARRFELSLKTALLIWFYPIKLLISDGLGIYYLGNTYGVSIFELQGYSWGAMGPSFLSF